MQVTSARPACRARASARQKTGGCEVEECTSRSSVRVDTPTRAEARGTLQAVASAVSASSSRASTRTCSRIVTSMSASRVRADCLVAASRERSSNRAAGWRRNPWNRSPGALRTSYACVARPDTKHRGGDAAGTLRIRSRQPSGRTLDTCGSVASNSQNASTGSALLIGWTWHRLRVSRTAESEVGERCALVSRTPAGEFSCLKRLDCCTARCPCGRPASILREQQGCPPRSAAGQGMPGR